MSGYGKPRGSKFWQKHGCEHSEMGFVSAIYCSNTSSVTLRATPFSLWLGHARVLTALRAVIHSPHAASLPTGEGWRKSLLSSAHKLNSRPPTLLCGRAGNACTNLLGSLVRYVRTRGMAEVVGSTKPPTFIFYRAARTRHAWLARLTRARRQWFGRRTA